MTQPARKDNQSVGLTGGEAAAEFVEALKGVVLSLQLYGNSTSRDARDIDLLVDPADFAAAGECLVAAGYRPLTARLSPRPAAAYRRWVKETEYVHMANGLRIELHHRLTDNPCLLPIPFAAVWEGGEEVLLAAKPVRTLGRHHLGLYLALHGAGHGGERLQWLVDLTVALRAPGAVDQLLAAAAAANVTAAVLQALLLAHEWLGLPLRPRTVAAAGTNPQVRRLNRVLAHFYSATNWYQTPRDGSSAALLRYSLWLRLCAYLLKDDWAYRKNQLMRDLSAPADWGAIRLPDRLFWLFYLNPAVWLADAPLDPAGAIVAERIVFYSVAP